MKLCNTVLKGKLLLSQGEEENSFQAGFLVGHPDLSCLADLGYPPLDTLQWR